MKKVAWLLGVTCCLLLNGCAHNVPPADYDISEVGKLKKVASGVIISKRPVTFHGKNTMQAAASMPGSEYIDGGRGYVYVIKLNNGAVVSVAQAEDLNLKVKQHVLVVYGKNTRVLPDDGSSES